MAATTLSHDDARRVYDRIGSFQDSQAFYEDKTTDELVAHGAFNTATRIFEFGCGTGRFAETLLRRLPETATYKGIDLSPTMVGLARDRLAPFGSRVEIALSQGGAPVLEPEGSCDRWVSTFVLDLLCDNDIDQVLAEAHRMLVPDGLLCLASLSTGSTWCSRMMASAWSAVHQMRADLVGGCRPLELRSHLAADQWEIQRYAAHAPFCIPSEAIVARRL